MAREGCLSAACPVKHSSGDTVRVSGGNPRRGGGRGSRSGIRNCLLVGGQASGSHGRGWPTSAVSGSLVTRHHFLFPGHVFFLQDANVDTMKLSNEQGLRKCLRADDFKYYFRLTRIDFLRYFPFFFRACFSST